MKCAHQFVAGYTHNDAISNEAAALRTLFESWGYRSRIYSETKRIPPELRGAVYDYSDCVAESGRNDLVILHLSAGSPVNEAFGSLNCRKVILYHNITPARYFGLINSQTAHVMATGRHQAEALAGCADINIADSEFNACELREWGYENVVVWPLMLDSSRHRVAPDRRVLKRYDDGLANILFVGRCAPNKKIEDLIHAFALYQRYVNPASRFIHVGSFAGVERYYYLLVTLARELGVQDVHFEGCVSQSELNAYYSCADLFLCMSEHEGFCIPLLESMALVVPVLAYASSAVPETMNGAGVLFARKEYESVSEMMGRMISDKALRSAITDGQRARYESYRRRDLAAELRRHLSPVLPI